MSESYDFGQICRHCETETVNPIECSITGSLPEWLDGSFLYNGPGLSKVGTKEYLHCFDSASILQKITVSKGSASYKSKYQNTDTYKRNQEAGTIVVGEFGTAPEIVEKKGFFSKLRKMADVESIISDNSVVSIEKIGGKYYTTGETPFLHELDLDTLENKSKISLYKHCSMVTQSPHPMTDSQGNVYTVGQGVSLMGPKYNVVKFAKDGSAPEVIARLAPRWRMSPCYMHSFGLTDNYLILIEGPLSVSLSNILTDMMHNVAFLDAMNWVEEPVHIMVLDLKTMKQVKKMFVLSTMFVLHLVNCYEDSAGDLVLEFPCYRDASMLHGMFIKTMQDLKGEERKEFAKKFITKYMRVVLPLSEPDTRTEVPLEGTIIGSDVSLENPVINPRVVRKKHRYVYGIGISVDANRGQVYKLDTETGEAITFKEDKLYTSDPVFVANPQGKDEDDGVLVVFAVVSDILKLGSLVVLNAKDLSETARISFEAKGTVTMPMHGIFVEK